MKGMVRWSNLWRAKTARFKENERKKIHLLLNATKILFLLFVFPF